MDIISFSTNLNHMKNMTSINISLLKKTINITNENAQIMIQDIKHMELSINPNIGSKFDKKI